MTHFMRTVASSAILAINHSSCGTLRSVIPIHVRTVFSSSGIGLDNFKLAREQYISKHAPSIDAFKKRFLNSIQSDSQVFTEDLRNMIMSADNDEEVNAVVQALKKYSTNKLKFTDYHFGSPIMRLLYIRNKPELAMELFMDESLKDIFRDSGSALILLNKLIEDKRYDDAIKIFEYGSQRGYSTASGRTYPTDVVMLTIEALYRQNTKKSLIKAKELITKVSESDADINPRTASMIALLAIQQGEPSFAMEILGAVRAQNLTTIQNIRAICYAQMGRVEEAINVVHLLADQPPIDNDRRRVFPLVLEYIHKAVEKSKDQDLKTRFDDLSKFVAENNRLSKTDLTDFINEPVSRRGAILPNRQGAQQGPSGGFPRNSRNFRDASFRDDYNKQSYNQRQGFGGSGYNRDNRSQPGRFANENYDRRPQNTFNENDRLSNRNQRSFRQENQAPPPPQPRSNEQKTPRSSGTKPGPMETTSTSPIPQRSKRIGDDNSSQSKSNQNFDKSPSFGKRDERLSGGNTGIQQQSPWDQGDRKPT